MAINPTNAGYFAQDMPNRPFVGWHSVIGPNGFSGAGTGSSNLWSPDTYTFWESFTFGIGGDTAYINLTAQGDGSVNYFAIAGHNLSDFSGSSLGDRTRVVLETSDDGSTWSIPSGAGINLEAGDDSPVIAFFDSVTGPFYRLRIEVGTEYSSGDSFRIAHIRMGTAFIPEMPYFVGNRPNDREVQKVVNQSDNGRYLGSTLVSVTRPYSLPQEDNHGDFVRDYVDPFLDHCQLLDTDSAGPKGTFFLAARPVEFRKETLYCHTPDNVNRPENQRPNGMMKWSISGVAER